MYSLGKDIKNELIVRFALVSTPQTAGGSGDNTEVDGLTIDTLGLPGEPTSVVFYVPFRAVLATTQTGIVLANLQDSANASSWADITTPVAAVTLIGVGNPAETGIVTLGYDLTKARRYIRIQVTPDLNRANTDTSIIGHGVAVFGGLNEVPSV